jgi:hypothetical protein
LSSVTLALMDRVLPHTGQRFHLQSNGLHYKTMGIILTSDRVAE